MMYILLPKIACQWFLLAAKPSGPRMVRVVGDQGTRLGSYPEEKLGWEAKTLGIRI